MININDSLNFLNPLKIITSVLDSTTFYIFGGLAMYEERAGISGALAEQEKGYAESDKYLQEQWDVGKEDVSATEAAGLEGYRPYQEAGTQALGDFQTLLDQGISQEQLEQDPSYQWRMQQGLQARERSASRYGSRFSGGLLAELEKYAQGEASAEYSNIYNRKAQGYGGLMGMGMQAEESANQWRGQMYGARRSLSDYYGGQIEQNIKGVAGARAAAVYGKYQASAKLYAGIHKDMAKMSMAFATKGQSSGGGETGLGEGSYGGQSQQGGMDSYNWGGSTSGQGDMSGGAWQQSISGWGSGA